MHRDHGLPRSGTPPLGTSWAAPLPGRGHCRFDTRVSAGSLPAKWSRVGGVDMKSTSPGSSGRRFTRTSRPRGIPRAPPARRRSVDLFGRSAHVRDITHASGHLCPGLALALLVLPRYPAAVGVRGWFGRS